MFKKPNPRKTFDAITAGLSKMAMDLRELSAAEAQRAQELDIDAELAHAKAEKARAECARAHATADKIEGLLS